MAQAQPTLRRFLPTRRTINHFASTTYDLTTGSLIVFLGVDYYRSYHKASYTIEGNSMRPTLCGSDLPSTLSCPPKSTTPGRSDDAYPLTAWAKNLLSSNMPKRDVVLVTKRLEPSRADSAKNKHARWTPARGSIMTFQSPTARRDGWFGWGSLVSIKRVVAVEGDVVVPVRRRVVRLDKGAEVERPRRGLADVYDAAGATRAGVGMPAQQQGPELEPQREPVTIPFGHVWVEGDDQEQTFDSNDYGPISKSLIEGQAYGIWRTWRHVERPDWEQDGWEERMKGRLKKRKEELWSIKGSREGDGGVPEEWQLYPE